MGKAWIAGLLMLLGIVEANAAASDCEQRQIGDVKLNVSERGLVLVPAKVAGREVYFQFEIGSGFSAVTQSAVELLGLRAKALTGSGVITSRGKELTQYVKLEDMVIGNFRLAARSAPVFPTDGPVREVDGRPVIGVLGSTLFRAVDAELNLGESQLKLFEQFRCLKRSPVYYWDGPAAELPMRFDAAGALVFTLQLNGRKIDSSVLSNDRDSRLDGEAAQKFFGIEPDEQPYHAMSLTNGALRFDDAKIRLKPNSGCKLTSSTPVYGSIGYATCMNGVPFALGTDLLSQLRIYIASARQKVYISKSPVAANESGTAAINPAQ